MDSRRAAFMGVQIDLSYCCWRWWLPSRYVAQRLKVPYPIVLVIAGLGISFVPHVPRVPLSPDLVFLIFLPPLLYAAAWMTSWHAFRFNLRIHRDAGAGTGGVYGPGGRGGGGSVHHGARLEVRLSAGSGGGDDGRNRGGG